MTVCRMVEQEITTHNKEKTMASIIPFKGVHYNPKKIKDLEDVATPPYDVISPQEQLDFHKRHPNNIIRLILGRQTDSDTDTDNVHTRAADFFQTWLSEDVLIQDKSPSFYFTSIGFEEENKTVTRYGLITLVGLEPFEKGIVLPHEKTFSRIKSERLSLMKKCHSNFSPIFSLYSDSDNNIMKSLKASILNKTPDMTFTDTKNHKQRLWKITDPAVHLKMAEAMKEKKLFIADGHHRYETALNYRAWIAANDPNFSADHPANYVMMYLSSMDDPGLVILPAHRLVSGIDDATRAKLTEKAAEYFDIDVFPQANAENGNIPPEFLSALKSNAEKSCIGLFMKNSPEFHLMTLKPGIMNRLFRDEMHESLRKLDVTVLTRLILIEILGFDQTGLDNENLIAYSSSADDAIKHVISGQCDVAFLLNPTKIEQVQDIADRKLIMPRKSTYFYPKVITGQVINKID